jgi:hypothetical protein
MLSLSVLLGFGCHDPFESPDLYIPAGSSPVQEEEFLTRFDYWRNAKKFRTEYHSPSSFSPSYSSSSPNSNVAVAGDKAPRSAARDKVSRSAGARFTNYS